MRRTNRPNSTSKCETSNIRESAYLVALGSFTMAAYTIITIIIPLSPRVCFSATPSSTDSNKYSLAFDVTRKFVRNPRLSFCLRYISSPEASPIVLRCSYVYVHHVYVPCLKSLKLHHNWFPQAMQRHVYANRA